MIEEKPCIRCAFYRTDTRFSYKETNEKAKKILFIITAFVLYFGLTCWCELEELPPEFDVKLFYSLVDYATVYHDERIVFQFRNGMEIETII